MIKDIKKILCESKISETILPVVPIMSEWMKMLGIHTRNASKEELRRSVSPLHTYRSFARYLSLNIQPVIKPRDLFFATARMDDIIRESGLWGDKPRD